MKKIIYLGLLLSIGACKKPHCPEPLPTSDSISVPTSHVITLQPGIEGKDAHLSSLTPTENSGTATFLHVSAWTVNGNLDLTKGIIQFDYSSIPTGAKITKATLTFFADTILNNAGWIGHSQLSGSNDWTLKRVTQAWNESTVTWANAPTTDPTNILKCATSTSNFENYVLDVTSFVQDEISHPTAYFGFLMQINNEVPYRAINFCSSDNQDVTLHPKIVIEYTK
jgi:hypothetical protein